MLFSSRSPSPKTRVGPDDGVGYPGLVLVPKAFREDKSRAEQSADLRLEGPKRNIQRLEGELEQSKTDLQEQKEQLADMV